MQRELYSRLTQSASLKVEEMMEILGDEAKLDGVLMDEDIVELFQVPSDDEENVVDVSSWSSSCESEESWRAGLRRAQPLSADEAFLAARCASEAFVDLPVRENASPLPTGKRVIAYAVRRGCESAKKRARHSDSEIAVTFQSVKNAEVHWVGTLGVASRPMSRCRARSAPGDRASHGYRGRMYTLVTRVESRAVAVENASIVHAWKEDVEQRHKGSLYVEGDLIVGGTIQGKFASPNADYAEHFEFKEGERAGPADVVRLHANKLTLKTSGRGLCMVVSTAPSIAAGKPADESTGAYVAFMGRVPVKCRGKVKAGDKLVPSGRNDGYAKTGPGRPLGIALEDKKSSGAGQVLVFVKWQDEHEQLSMAAVLVLISMMLMGLTLTSLGSHRWAPSMLRLRFDGAPRVLFGFSRVSTATNRFYDYDSFCDSSFRFQGDDDATYSFGAADLVDDCSKCGDGAAAAAALALAAMAAQLPLLRVNKPRVVYFLGVLAMLLSFLSIGTFHSHCDPVSKVRVNSTVPAQDSLGLIALYADGAGLCVEDGLEPLGCYISESLQIRDCECHPTCGACGYFDDPTERHHCISCADNDTLVTAVRDDGTGYCGGEGPQDFEGCYWDFGVPLADCECHESCRACGYSTNPVDSDSCITCADGTPVVAFNDDGTGFCGSEEVEDGCYAAPSAKLRDCACHDSCAACGYSANPSTRDSCITCSDPSADLVVKYLDGTGRCVSDSEPPDTPGNEEPSAIPDPDPFSDNVVETDMEGCYMTADFPISDCTCHESCKACGYGENPTAMTDCISCPEGTSFQPAQNLKIASALGPATILLFVAVGLQFLALAFRAISGPKPNIKRVCVNNSAVVADPAFFQNTETSATPVDTAEVESNGSNDEC